MEKSSVARMPRSIISRQGLGVLGMLNAASMVMGSAVALATWVNLTDVMTNPLTAGVASVGAGTSTGTAIFVFGGHYLRRVLRRSRT